MMNSEVVKMIINFSHCYPDFEYFIGLNEYHILCFDISSIKEHNYTKIEKHYITNALKQMGGFPYFIFNSKTRRTLYVLTPKTSQLDRIQLDAYEGYISTTVKPYVLDISNIKHDEALQSIVMKLLFREYYSRIDDASVYVNGCPLLKLEKTKTSYKTYTFDCLLRELNNPKHFNGKDYTVELSFKYQIVELVKQSYSKLLSDDKLSFVKQAYDIRGNKFVKVFNYHDLKSDEFYAEYRRNKNKKMSLEYIKFNDDFKQTRAYIFTKCVYGFKGFLAQFGITLTLMTKNVSELKTGLSKQKKIPLVKVAESVVIKYIDNCINKSASNIEYVLRMINDVFKNNKSEIILSFEPYKNEKDALVLVFLDQEKEDDTEKAINKHFGGDRYSDFKLNTGCVSQHLVINPNFILSDKEKTTNNKPMVEYFDYDLTELSKTDKKNYTDKMSYKIPAVIKELYLKHMVQFKSLNKLHNIIEKDALNPNYIYCYLSHGILSMISKDEMDFIDITQNNMNHDFFNKINWSKKELIALIHNNNIHTYDITKEISHIKNTMSYEKDGNNDEKLHKEARFNFIKRQHALFKFNTETKDLSIMWLEYDYTQKIMLLNESTLDFTTHTNILYPIDTWRIKPHEFLPLLKSKFNTKQYVKFAGIVSEFIQLWNAIIDFMKTSSIKEVSYKQINDYLYTTNNPSHILKNIKDRQPSEDLVDFYFDGHDYLLNSTELSIMDFFETDVAKDLCNKLVNFKIGTYNPNKSIVNDILSEYFQKNLMSVKRPDALGYLPITASFYYDEQGFLIIPTTLDALNKSVDRQPSFRQFNCVQGDWDIEEIIPMFNVNWVRLKNVASYPFFDKLNRVHNELTSTSVQS